jgi:general nucleoside transport system permease protein
MNIVPAVRRIWSVLAVPLISILLALLVGAVIIIASELAVGQQLDLLLPLEAYAGLIQGAIGSETAIVNSLVAATPLILGGLSVAFGFRAGLFNIGAQGQFLLGLLGAVWIGVAVAQMPPVIAISLALIGGVLAGALWGFIPGVLKALSGAHEVVTTIMLNYVAGFLLAWAVNGPLRVALAPAGVTEDVGNAALPILIGRNGHFGLLLALLAVGIVSFVLFRTTFGFEVRTVGANADAARYAGMRPRRLIVITMSICGALAGLAGAIEMLGIAHKTQTSYATSVGWDSIAIALLGRSSPLGVLAAALLFGAMRQGAGGMELRSGIPIELIDVLQATILLFLVANPVLRKVLRLRNVKTGVGPTDQITRSYVKEAVP